MPHGHSALTLCCSWALFPSFPFSLLLHPSPHSSPFSLNPTGTPYPLDLPLRIPILTQQEHNPLRSRPSSPSTDLTLNQAAGNPIQIIRCHSSEARGTMIPFLAFLYCPGVYTPRFVCDGRAYELLDECFFVVFSLSWWLHECAGRRDIGRCSGKFCASEFFCFTGKLMLIGSRVFFGCTNIGKDSVAAAAYVNTNEYKCTID